MSEQYPHKCPLCGSDAYVGAYAVKCSNAWCKHFEPPKFEYPKADTFSPELRDALLKAAVKVYRFKAVQQPSGIYKWLPDPVSQDDTAFYPDDDDCDASD